MAGIDEEAGPLEGLNPRARPFDLGTPIPISFDDRSDPDADVWVADGVDEALSPDWSVPWSDLMMVMFVMFAVLFMYRMAERDIDEAFTGTVQETRHESSPSGSEEPDPTAPSDVTPESLAQQSRRAVEESNLDNVDVELQADKSVKLSVSGPMFFDLGAADLRPETARFLRRIAAVIARTDHRVQIVGHTDTVPVHSDRFPTNWELSAIRATTVARYLLEAADIDPSRFSVAAHSMYSPAVPNDSLVHKARNRRVEIIFSARAKTSQEAGRG